VSVSPTARTAAASHDDSSVLFERARRVIPGGVNSPVRAFGSVGGTPRFVSRAEGAHVFDADGRRYVDYVGSWGPMLLGHAHPEVIAAVQVAAENGLSFGAPTHLETEMAERICAIVPSIESVRMCSSGTEATMSAIRLARGFTGRDDILKFEGCYHGHSDALLVKAGSGALTLGVPSSPGIPADVAKHTLTLPFNDEAALRTLFAERGDSLGCVIVEPICGNMNFVEPHPGFLEALRELCDRAHRGRRDDAPAAAHRCQDEPLARQADARQGRRLVRRTQAAAASLALSTSFLSSPLSAISDTMSHPPTSSPSR